MKKLLLLLALVTLVNCTKEKIVTVEKIVTEEVIVTNQYTLVAIAGEGAVCNESKTTVGKVDDKNCIVMLYDVDMPGMQELMSSEYLIELTKKMNIINNEMNSFEPLQQ